MVVGICTVEIYIPEANSLKSKRAVVKSVVQRLRNKFNVSVCELENQDLWQRATLGMACISSSKDVVQKLFSSTEDFLVGVGTFEVTGVNIEIF